MGMVTTWLNSPNLLGLPSVASLSLKNTHHGMMPIISAIRWPPDPETAPITGQNLVETYRHYFACASTSQSAVDRFQWEGTSGAFQEEMSLM
jgi:hypothetical protein